MSRPSSPAGPDDLHTLRRGQQHAREPAARRSRCSSTPSRWRPSTTSWTCSSAGCSPSPRAFRELFISEGMAAVAWEFQQPELGAEFTRDAVVDAAARGRQQHGAHAVRLGPAAGQEAHVHPGDRRAPVATATRCSTGCPWTGRRATASRRTSADAEDRAHDFGLVNQGYLGYMNLGYTAREVDLFVWLEALRDKQCAEKPCELGIFLNELQGAHGRLPGPDPHPRDDRAGRHRPVPRGAGADRVLQPAARRHRPGVPAGAAVPGRVPAEQDADRDRPARVVPARAREAGQPRRRRRAASPGTATRGRRRPSRRWRSSAPGRPG